jgi:predicted TIM-barrel fold metal-dependent hydrolase
VYHTALPELDVATMTALLPPGSWDTHVHLFDPDQHGAQPDGERNGFTPPHHNAGHIVKSCPSHNFVVVVPFNQNTETKQTVNAINSLNSMGRKAKGTIVLQLKEMEETNLRKLHGSGIRAVRIHEASARVLVGNDENVEQLVRDVAEKIAVVGWRVDLFLPLEVWARLAPTLRDVHKQLGTTFIADHLCCAGPDDADSEALTEALRLVEEGVLHVKISALNRFCGPKGVEALEAVVRKFVGCRRGEQTMFGSDWPHVIMGPGGRTEQVDLDRVLRFLHRCCDGDEQLWGKLVRDNAARVYT